MYKTVAVVYIILRPGRNLGMENGPLSFPYILPSPRPPRHPPIPALPTPYNISFLLFSFRFFILPHSTPGIKRSFLFIGRQYKPLCPSHSPHATTYTSFSFAVEYGIAFRLVHLNGRLFLLFFKF